MDNALLSVNNLFAGYGEAQVLADIALRLEEGRRLALLGRNGVGKTTLLCTLMGLTRRTKGAITFAGHDISRLPSYQRAQLGLGFVPQERAIFQSLTVEENMSALAFTREDVKTPWTLERIYGLFPRLQERRKNMGTQLSGGEQQMLALARALMLNPRLLLLDEPLEGLAPIIVDELLHALRRLAEEEGLSMIIVEQKAQKILPFTDDVMVLDRGQCVHQAKSADLLNDPSALQVHLGVGEKKAARG